VDDPQPDSATRWHAVSHAHVRHRDGRMVVGAPSTDRHIALPAIGGLTAWQALCEGADLRDVISVSGLTAPEASDLIEALAMTGLITPHAPPPARVQFHDALAHARSRGRTDEGFGQSTEDNTPRPALVGSRIELPAVDEGAAGPDAPFSSVVLSRRTARSWSADDLTLQQVSELLQRTGRRRLGAEPASYPYPYAGPDGAAHLAIAAGRVRGLGPALYLYDASDHSLTLVPAETPNSPEPLAVGAYLQTVAQGERVGARHPSLLLMVMSDLELMASAYRGVALANTLRTTGAILATASLCAAAMGLATTILGLAAEDDFLGLYRNSLPHLSSTGELAIGRPAG